MQEREKFKQFLNRHCIIEKNSGAIYSGVVVGFRRDRLCIAPHMGIPAMILNNDMSFKVSPKNGLTRWIRFSKIKEIYHQGPTNGA